MGLYAGSICSKASLVRSQSCAYPSNMKWLVLVLALALALASHCCECHYHHSYDCLGLCHCCCHHHMILMLRLVVIVITVTHFLLLFWCLLLVHATQERDSTQQCTWSLQDWHGVQAYLPFLEALHSQWLASKDEASLLKRTQDLISVPIVPSLDFLSQFGTGRKKRPWGHLRLAYKPVFQKSGQQCSLRERAFRCCPLHFA